MSRARTPSRYLQKLAAALFSDSDARDAFIDSLTNPATYPESILWMSARPSDFPFECVERLSWQPEYVDRLVSGQRPGAHALHQQGAYYCLDLSSVFAAQVLTVVPEDISLLLDLCAAPGGKAACAYRLLAPERIICNETIGKRLGALTSNLKRCNIKPAFVTNRDPRELRPLVESALELVVVDAPCSGQSLLTKGEESAGCFHPTTINLNKNRQRRIIAEAGAMVAPGGYLAYMTCTFAADENEELIEWFIKKFPYYRPLEVPLLSEFQSTLSDLPCYRLWPQLGLGAGSFTAIFQNSNQGLSNDIDWERLPIAWRNI